MISRTSIHAALFAILVTAALAGTAQYQAQRSRGAADTSATALATAQLPMVVITAKRIPAAA